MTTAVKVGMVDILLKEKWLVENVGESTDRRLGSAAGVGWRWQIDWRPTNLPYGSSMIVEFEDEKLAQLFLLRWL